MRGMWRGVTSVPKRIGGWLEDRTGLAAHLRPLIGHAVPPGTTRGRTGWWYIFGFGAMVALLVQGITGAVLATAYIPSAAHAYDSLVYITEEAPFGELVRGMHYYGASAMVILVVAHMVRVFLTGSYKYPREVGWLAGVGLFVLTMALAFTGQLLRWDENGVWSVSVAVHYFGRMPLIGEQLAQFILAGEAIGGATLSRFFALHVFFLPALLLILLALHLFLVIRNGISEPPKAGRPVEPGRYRAWYDRMLRRAGRPYWPDAAWREATFAAAIIAIIFLLALLVGPRPLAGPPDPTFVEVNPSPDWYLLWYYALFSVYPRGWSDLVMVYGPLLFLAAMIALPLIANKGERSTSRRPWAVGVVAALLIAWGSLTVAGSQAPWVPAFDTEPMPVEVIGTDSGPVYEGAMLFHERGCQYCHQIAGHGGVYGPDLTETAQRLSRPVIKSRIMAGFGTDMPSYAGILTPEELDLIVLFMERHAGR